MKVLDYPPPSMRIAENEWDRPRSVECKEKWVMYDYRYLNEESGKVINAKGFAIENDSDPHYGIQFNSQEELEEFIVLLKAAAKKTWGSNEVD